MHYGEDNTASPFVTVNASAAQTNQTVNLGPSGLKLVPFSCRMARLKVIVNANAGVVIDNSEMSTSPAGGTGYATINATMRGGIVDMPLDANQSFRFANNAASGNTSMFLMAYLDHR
jgi:hypothetical protein